MMELEIRRKQDYESKQKSIAQDFLKKKEMVKSKTTARTNQ